MKAVFPGPFTMDNIPLVECSFPSLDHKMVLLGAASEREVPKVKELLDRHMSTTAGLLCGGLISWARRGARYRRSGWWRHDSASLLVFRQLLSYLLRIPNLHLKI
jgi:hypothetical protein